MSNFTPTPIKKIGRVVTGKTPSTSIADNFDGEYMFVTPSELHTDFIIKRSEKTLTRRGLDSIRTNSVKGLSIAVGCIGWDMGNVALINEECATNQQINSVTDINADEYNPYYLYYWLLTKKAYLFQISTVTRTPILNKSTFEDILVPLPSKSIQDRVASVLLPISRKIAINNAIIAELEKTAKLLYDYWFTQFEFPDAEGKPYRSSGGAMEYNAQLKREIPKGWTLGALSDIAYIIMGQSPKGTSYNTERDGMIFFQGCTDFGHRFPTSRVYTNKPSRIAEQGDILFSVRAPVGTTNIAYEKCCVGRGLSVLRSKIGANSYLYQVIQGVSERLNTMSGNGTTFGAVTKDMLYELPVCKPEVSVIKAYEDKIAPMDRLIFKYEMQTRELTALRDFLLPLLMNGQVTVATADSVAELLS